MRTVKLVTLFFLFLVVGCGNLQGVYITVPAAVTVDVGVQIQPRWGNYGHPPVIIYEHSPVVPLQGDYQYNVDGTLHLAWHCHGRGCHRSWHHTDHCLGVHIPDPAIYGWPHGHHGH